MGSQPATDAARTAWYLAVRRPRRKSVAGKRGGAAGGGVGGGEGGSGGVEGVNEAGDAGAVVVLVRRLGVDDGGGGAVGAYGGGERSAFLVRGPGQAEHFGGDQEAGVAALGGVAGEVLPELQRSGEYRVVVGGLENHGVGADVEGEAHGGVDVAGPVPQALEHVDASWWVGVSFRSDA